MEKKSPKSKKKKLPIGIQTYSQIIEEEFCYVDKTGFIAQLVEEGKYYFLSRPRRFGKSLLISTMSSVFKARKKLFKGLNIEKNWNWATVYPVIDISFGRGIVEDRKGLDERIETILKEIADQYTVTLSNNNIADRFAELIHQLYKKYSQPVVVLVDEYDKPILDNIDKPDKAAEILEGLKNIYSVIKDCDGYIKFAFLTGVSKFCKVSLFSGLNNLKDITLDERYATICGYTENDLHYIFNDYTKQADLDKLKSWYNGYNYLGEKVYNPYDILLFFDSYRYKNYWFESASPTFLIKLLKKRQYFIPALENLQVSESILGSFDLENLFVETLLFQTGYLTIKEVEMVGPRQVYTLNYPNMEVKLSLLDYLLDFYIQDINEKNSAQTDLYKALEKGDLALIKNIFFNLFASIPHDWYRKNELENYEGYYASITYACLASLGFEMVSEDTTNHGRIDLTLFSDDKIYIFEFKVKGSTKERNTAFDQIKTKKYHEKYMNQSKDIYRIGIDFNKKERNIDNFEWDIIKKNNNMDHKITKIKV